MKISDHLSDKQKKQLNKLKKKENLSLRDIKDLMGSNNRGMKRKKGGAWTNG